MATALIQTAEDQITCTICFEIFTEPKALPCLHTFCKNCIQKYIMENNTQYRGRKGYPCPVCRRHVSVPARIKHNPKVWANQLENNHVVSTMIDAYKTQERRNSIETCKLHPGKELEYFCVDHSQYICSLCIPHHRCCYDVTTHEEARKQAVDSQSDTLGKERSVHKQVDLLSEHCSSIEKVINKRKTALEFLGQTDNQVKDEITSMRKKLQELMNTHDEMAGDASEENREASDRTNTQRSQGPQLQNIKLAYQGKPSWITGITVLPSGKLLLVDHTNEAVFVFTHSLEFLCKTNIHPAPYDLAALSTSEDDVVLSIPDTNELIKCVVQENGIVEVGQKLKTNITCKAVACDERNVAVCSNTDLQIFETDGAVWMILLDESYAQTEFTYITMVSSKKKVFITDQTYPDPHIKCLDFDGSTLWKVVDVRINLCTGISIIGTKLIVTSWNSGEIFTLLFNGNDLKTFSEGLLTFPWKLHASSRQNIVCVSQHKDTLSETDKRTVKVFLMT